MRNEMKRIFVLSLLALFILALSAFAGEYHQGSSLNCYQCHTMHYSQQHQFGYSHESDPFLGPDGPYNGLLRAPVNDLCLSCHDGEDVIDVYQASDVNTTVNRQSGFLNRVGDPNTNCGHTLDATDIAPGSNPAWSDEDGLNCADCHSPHGTIRTGSVPHPDQVKGQWRILRDRPGTYASPNYAFVSYEKSSEPVDMTKDVKWRASSAHADGAYETDNTDFYEPVADGSRYAYWCQGCHSNFHGNSSDPDMYANGGWVRHPAAEENLGTSGRADFALHAYRPQVMSPTGDWGIQGDSTWNGGTVPTDLTPSCFSCHKAHGNNNAFGLVYMTGRSTGPRSENGDATRITATCKVCHSQGGF